MQSSLLALRYGLGGKYLATSQCTCSGITKYMVVAWMSINGHYLLMENWPALFQPNWFAEAEFLGPPGDTYVPHHNGLGEPSPLDIKSIKISEFYEQIKCSCGGWGILKMKLKVYDNLKIQIYFPISKD